MTSSEIQLRKLKLRLRDKRFANHKAPCTVIWQQPVQSVLALRGCSATDLFIYILLYITSRGVKGDWDFQISDLVKNPDGTDI